MYDDINYYFFINKIIYVSVKLALTINIKNKKLCIDLVNVILLFLIFIFI